MELASGDYAVYLVGSSKRGKDAIWRLRVRGVSTQQFVELVCYVQLGEAMNTPLNISRLSMLPPAIRTRFRRGTEHLRGNLLAPPLTNNYSLIGEAFDYLLRFYVKRLNPEAKISWVESGGIVRLGTNFDRRIKAESNLRKKQFLVGAKRSYSQYLSCGKFTDELLALALYLSGIDLGGHYPFERHEVDIRNIEGRRERLEYLTAMGISLPKRYELDTRDIEDLRNLLSLVVPSTFTANRLAVIAPAPRDGTRIGPDLLLDDMLMDIKTTKDLHLRSVHVNQLIGNHLALLRTGITGVHRCQRLRNSACTFRVLGTCS